MWFCLQTDRLKWDLLGQARDREWRLSTLERMGGRMPESIEKTTKQISDYIFQI